ncbi:pseudaminic acid cytidylyltransferase [Marinagarivorans algicola]|uniref:pseudaminic acid cytidylyltransferase n=1 Tax=Marinagarivorans algicola TaxID=1513270 RepID=UPI000B1E4926|nr:pseudaminic acid cytidylyltransferase [Marinagarivorans algicola]
MINVAIIPARGGSQRIPQKNIKPFLGKPIIQYAIDTAKASGLFDHIVVSTDSQAIAECALALGAEVPFMRPAALADHFTGTHAVMAHAILACSEYYHQKIQYACCIYPTSPLLTVKSLIRGLDLLQADECDFVVSATEYPFAIQRAILPVGNHFFVPHNRSAMAMRSQDLPVMYHDAGQFYWGSAQAYIDHAPLWGDRTQAIILPRTHVQDIDTLEDWQLAEMKYQLAYPK